MKVLILASWPLNGVNSKKPTFVENQFLAIREQVDAKIFDCSQKRGPLPGFLKNLKTAHSIYKTLRKEKWKPDIIHAHVAYPAGVIALGLKKIYGSKLVLTEHTGPLSLLEKYFVTKSTFNKIFSKFDKIVAVSEFLKSDILKGDPSLKVEVLGNVVRPDFFEKNFDRGPFRFQIGFLARFTIEKGTLDFLNALKILDEKISGPLTVGIMGEGPLESEIKSTFKKFKFLRLEILRSDSNESIVNFLNSCLFVVVPSHVETFSLVTAEALALGKPVIVTDCGGPRDFVLPEFGELIPPKDPEKLAHAIWTYLEKFDGEFNLEEAKNRRMHIVANFSMQRIGQKLQNIYSGLLAKPNKI